MKDGVGVGGVLITVVKHMLSMHEALCAIPAQKKREGVKERGRGKGKERGSKEDISSYASDLCHV